MKKRLFTKLLITSALITVLTAGATLVSQASGHMVFGQTQTYSSLDPSNEYDGWMIERAGVGETLTKLDSSLNTVGWLVEDDYTVSEDGLTWTFTIKDEVCFSNGTKLTAELAMASIQYDFDNSARAADFFSLDSMTADGQTLTITTTEPAPTLPGMLADPFFVIFDTTVDLTNLADEGPICTGPYVIESNDQISMTLNVVKNENYWDGEPQLDSIEFLQFQDPSVMNLSFQAGELDACYGLSTSDAAAYMEDDNYILEMCNGLRTDWGLMNQNGLLSDKSLRIALLECLDMETICEVQLNGMFQAGNTPFASEALGVNDLENPYSYDIEDAAALLAEAGYVDTDGDGIIERADGTPVILEVYSYTTRAELPIICEALQYSASTLGIKMNINYVQDLWAGTIQEGSYDICIFNSSGFHSGDAAVFLQQFFKSDAVYNAYGYANEEVDALITSLENVFDTDERVEIEREISQILMDDACCAFYSYPTIYIAAKNTVSGLECTPADYYWITADVAIAE
ncbi:MAG: ABC transporter substrate-binding protein [Lachnospiraceae bacterium]|nr:ABC transporter substrate-binding protein [Lachnospiraceae bacterium]